MNTVVPLAEWDRRVLRLPGDKVWRKSLELSNGFSERNFFKKSRAWYCVILCVIVVLLRVLVKFLFSWNRVAYSRENARCPRPESHTYGHNTHTHTHTRTHARARARTPPHTHTHLKISWQR